MTQMSNYTFIFYKYMCVCCPERNPKHSIVHQQDNIKKYEYWWGKT